MINIKPVCSIPGTLSLSLALSFFTHTLSLIWIGRSEYGFLHVTNKKRHKEKSVQSKQRKKKTKVFITPCKWEKRNKMYYVLARVFLILRESVCVFALSATAQKIHKTTIKINGLTKSIMQINLFLFCMRVVSACVHSLDCRLFSLANTHEHIVLCFFVWKCLGITAMRRYYYLKHKPLTSTHLIFLSHFFCTCLCVCRLISNGHKNVQIKKDDDSCDMIWCVHASSVRASNIRLDSIRHSILGQRH